MTEGPDKIGEPISAPSATVAVSTPCPKTNPKNDNPLAGLVVKVIVLVETV